MTAEKLRERLQQKFDLENWKRIIEACFPERTFYSTPKLPEERIRERNEYQRLAEHVHHIGEVNLSDGTSMALIDVKLKDGATQLTRNRVGLRKLVDSEVIAGVRDAAIIVYHQPDYKEWRISFYSEQYGWDEDKGIIKEETNAKRYTFVVGGDETCRTASQRLHMLTDKSTEKELKDVLEAFSVQKVSKEFFDEYKKQYDKFVGYLTGEVWKKSGVEKVETSFNQLQAYFGHAPDPQKEARDFVKKLLGRIVFLYFVQKKKWIGSETPDFKRGDTNFIYNLFHSIRDDQKYSFYATWLAPLFFESLNVDNDHKFEMPDGNVVYIPFLNGGLFEMDETDKKAQGISIPADFFSHSDERKREEPNERGFLDFLSAYNFTIHEDSPGDHTIAVDPEMLGQIFENLLEDNKDKGAYYTPKPIVHYMCQESLIEYLLTRLPTECTEEKEREELRSTLGNLIKNQEAGGLVEYTEEILKALKDVKVCDPAIGSGAFPMGILQEIYQAVETLHLLSPDNVRAIWELPDDDWYPAEVKKQIIQNSIYGVDIEKGAVDIARLRFWLSLIVDEEEPAPLPNLDYKIVVGDSLVSRLIIDGEEQIVNINWNLEGEVGSTKEHLKNLKSALNVIVEKQKIYFNADTKKKEKLKKEIEQLKIEALIHQLHFDREDYVAKNKDKGNFFEENTERKLKLISFNELIKKLENHKKDPSTVHYFDWRIDFPEILNEDISKDYKFDIVIANPPYKVLGNKDLHKDTMRDMYQVTKGGKVNLYKVFYEKGVDLLKRSGVLTYISPSNYLTSGNSISLREFLLDRTTLIEIIDYEESDRIFEEVTQAVLTVVLKKEKKESFKFSYKKLGKEYSITKKEILNTPGLLIKGSNSVIKKINSHKDSFEEIVNGWQGEINVSTKKKHFTTKRESDKQLKLVRGNNIGRYKLIEEPGEFCSTEITNRDHHKEGRIVFQEVSNAGLDIRIKAVILENILCGHTTNYIIPKKGKGLTIQSILGLLNSKLFNYYFKFYNQTNHVPIGEIKNIPVPSEIKGIDDGLKKLVDQILIQKEANPEADTAALEQQIDTLVYKLYNLTWEEVKVVDPEFELSKEEYEKISIAG